MTNRMGALAHENLLLALEQLAGWSDERESQIMENEDKLDIYEDRISNYLVEVSQHGVSMDDIRTVSRLLHAVGDFERIGDHALNTRYLRVSTTRTCPSPVRQGMSCRC